MSKDRSQTVATGEEPAGGSTGRQPYQDLRVSAKEVPSVTQDVPLPVVFGRARLAGIFITPIFNLLATPIVEEVDQDAK